MHDFKVGDLVLIKIALRNPELVGQTRKISYISSRGIHLENAPGHWGGSGKGLELVVKDKIDIKIKIPHGL